MQALLDPWVWRGIHIMSQKILGGRPNFISKCFFITILFLSRFSFADQLSSLEALLTSFGTGCSIYGQQGQSLFETTKALSTTLKNILEDKSCQPLASVAAEVQGSLDRLVDVAPRYTDQEIAYQSLLAKKKALVAALGSESNPDMLSKYSDDLRDLEVKIAQAKQEMDLAKVNQKNTYMANALASYKSSTDSLLTLMVANQDCLIHHPSVAETLGNVGLSLAQSATLGVATSGISTLAGAGIYTISRLAQFARESANSKLIRSLSSPFLATALSCTLERLNNHYCESDRVEKLGRFVLSPEYNSLRRNDIRALGGLELLDMALPALDASLLRIQVGNSPSSAPDGEARAAINAAMALLRGSPGVLAGSLRDLKKNIDAIPNNIPSPDRRDQILRLQKNFVTRFLSSVNVNGSDGTNGGMGSSYGLNAIFSGSKAKYFLMGFDPDRIKPTEQNFQPFDILNLPERYPDPRAGPWELYSNPMDKAEFFEDFSRFEIEVNTNFKRWYDLALNDLNTKSNIIIKTDKKDIISSFTRPIPGSRKMTPMQGILLIAQYLKEPENIARLSTLDQKIAVDVVRTLENGLVANLNSISFDDPNFEAVASQKFKDILDATHYTDDSQFLVSRINVLIGRVVEEATIELYRQGKFDLIYALASGDIVRELLGYAGREKTVVDMINDAMNTKSMATEVSAAYFNAFNEPFKKALDQIQQPVLTSANLVLKGHLCLQFLGLEQNKIGALEKSILKACEGVGMPKIVGVPDSPVFTKALWTKPVQERTCTHYLWRQKLELMEKGLEDHN